MPFRNLCKSIVFCALLIAVCSCNSLRHSLNISESYEAKMNQRMTLTGNTVRASINIVNSKRKLLPDHSYFRNILFWYDTGKVVEKKLVTIDLRGIKDIKRIDISFPYDTAKLNGRLLMQDSVIDLKHIGNWELGNPWQIDSHIDAFSALATQINIEPMFTPVNHPYSIQEKILIPDFTFSFPYGKNTSSTLSPSAPISENPIPAFIYNLADRRVLVRTLIITGRVSPDEEITLAARRSAAIEKQLMTGLDLLKIDRNSILIQKKTDLTLDTLKNLIKEYHGMTEEEKLNSIGIIEKNDRATALKRLRREPAYNKIKKDLFPQMQTATVEMQAEPERKTDYEIYRIAKDIIDEKTIARSDKLLSSELNYAAENFFFTDNKKEKLYTKSIQESNDLVAKINLAALKLRHEKKAASLDSASMLLESSIRQAPRFETRYNLALIKYYRDKFEQLDHIPALLADATGTTERQQANLLLTSLNFRKANYDAVLTRIDDQTMSDAEKIMVLCSAVKTGEVTIMERVLRLSSQVRQNNLTASEKAIFRYQMAKAKFIIDQSRNKEALEKHAVDFVEEINAALNMEGEFVDYLVNEDGGSDLLIPTAPWRLPKTTCWTEIDVSELKLSKSNSVALSDKIKKSLRNLEYESVTLYNIPDQNGFIVLHKPEKCTQNGTTVTKERFTDKFVPWSQLSVPDKIKAPFFGRENLYRVIVFVYSTLEGAFTDDKIFTNKSIESYLAPANVTPKSFALTPNGRLQMLVYEFIQDEGAKLFKRTSITGALQHYKNSGISKLLSKP